MAAEKRSLYQLAPTQTPPPRIRKTLVQGRLESPAIANITSDTTRLQSPRHFTGFSNEAYDPSVHGTKMSLSRSIVPGAESIGIHSVVPNPKMSLESKMTNGTHEIPRHNQPMQYTMPGQRNPVISPPAAQPSSSLSLSDNDDDNHTRPAQQPLPQTPKNSHNSPVLLTDASSRHNSPDRRDVPVVTSVVTSPVKVICHSPRRDRQDNVAPSVGGNTLSVTGHTESARKVKVNGVQRINLDTKREGKSKRIEELDASLSEDSLDDSHIPTIAGSPVDPRSTAVRVALDEDDKENAIAVGPSYNPRQYKSFMGDVDENHGQGPLSAGLDNSNVRQQLFDYSVASVDASLLAGDISRVSATGEEKAEKRKKKSKTRIVPSRYMSSSSSKKTKPASKITEKKNSSFSSKSKVTFAGTTSTRAYSSHDASQLNTTAPQQHHNIRGSKMLTSTPAVGSMGVLPGHLGLDSAAPTPILPPSSMYSTGGLGYHLDNHSVAKHISGISSKMTTDALRAEKTKKAQKMKAQPIVPQATHPETTSRHSQEASHGGEVSQRQLELEYARLMQWRFLESKLKSTFATQEKDAQAQLYSMWQENEKLRRHLTELQMEQEKRNKMAELDRQLDTQLSGLEAIGGNIPKLILEHAQLSEALDTTRHYMPVNGVLLSDNHEELLVALDESERLLGEMEALTRGQTSKLSTFSKEMTTLAKIAQSEVQEHSRCRELLAATATLTTQERSLQADIIQDQ